MSIYLLPGGDETKVWYMLGLGMRMKIHFFRWECVWNSETRLHLTPLPSLIMTGMRTWTGQICTSPYPIKNFG